MFYCLAWACLLGLACGPKASSDDKTRDSMTPGQKIEINVNVQPPRDEVEGLRNDNSPILGMSDEIEEAASESNRFFPEPPEREVSEPERLIHYYCRCWKDESWDKMYGMLDENARRAIPFEEFKQRYQEDTDTTGALKDEKLVEELTNSGHESHWKVQLVFRNKRTKPRDVVAKCKHGVNGYRLLECGLIPIDLNNL